MEKPKVYAFIYPYEIEDCSDCPLWYDYIYCLVNKYNDDITHTDYEEKKRPDNCPLKEIF